MNTAIRAGLVAVLLLAATPLLARPLDRAAVMAALPKLEELARKAVAEGAVPGIGIAVVHRDELVFLKGFGLREAGKPGVVDGDTVFQIASASKPVSATVVAALVGRGIVQWESRIADLDPGFQLFEPYPTAQLTVRDLFAHRSGLPGSAGNDLEDIGYSREEVLHRLRLVPPSSSFRAGYAYSNAGITEGAIAAAKPTGKPWEDVAEQLLFGPLGMSATSYRTADFLARSNRSELHIKLDGAWAAKIKRDPSVQAPAGAVSSSPRDLARWMRLVLAGGSFDGQRLIAAEALAATHVPLMARGSNPLTGGASFYGLGWNVEFGRHGLSWGHAGAFSVGGRTLVTLYPESDIGIVILTNAFPTGLPEGLADSFFDLAFDGAIAKDWTAGWDRLYAGLFGPAIAAARQLYAAPPVPATPALPDAAYLGTYANDYAGSAAVWAGPGGLTLAVGPGGARVYPLRHFDRDLFLYFPDAEMPDKPSAIRFAIRPDGKAASINIESLDDNGLGTLRRLD
ncbi:MAG TPA: serine hydrolase [Xanthobacteraceae bacterium]|nr:serine hydrolase [Xanthobacteraceae bacterium]